MFYYFFLLTFSILHELIIIKRYIVIILNKRNIFLDDNSKLTELGIWVKYKLVLSLRKDKYVKLIKTENYIVSFVN